MEVLSSTVSAILPTGDTVVTVVSELGSFQSRFLWFVILGFLLAFLLGAGMGANDVSNAFGTSVGSKVLTIKKAYILATIMETFGTVLLGFNVADTMRKGVVDVNLYEDDPGALMLGQVAILAAGTTWLAIATFLKLPVSTTHSVVGATIGFSILFKGFDGIQWTKVIEIVISWVISPLFSGLVAVTMYILLDFACLRRSDPLKYGYILLPFFFFFVFFANSFMILLSGSKLFNLPSLSVQMALLGSVVVGLLAAFCVQFFLKPWLRNWVEKKGDSKNSSNLNNISVVFENDGIQMENLESENSKNNSEANIVSREENPRLQKFECSWKGFWRWVIPDPNRVEDQKTLRMFGSLQVFTACFAGFAHGANDTFPRPSISLLFQFQETFSNAIAPITALISIYQDSNVHQTTPTPVYILLFGTFSVCIGLWLFGHRVIKTIGDDVTEVNQANGFIVEFGAASTAMVASKLGLPISTTHAVVGAVVGVGLVKPGSGVNWKVFWKIASSWVITLPISGLLSAGFMMLLKLAL
ncbi:hypothetical protein FO519_004927 [Halicephalobus sp. NKZ332]|nr:hypothetical protein FO519_004927 [Halicephalobus sp. NKZ332]